MNTSEQLKAQAIRKAWIAEIGEKEFARAERFIKGYSGWLDDKFNQANLTFVFALNPNFDEYRYVNTAYSYSLWRPKSLQYIENNNGWIRIEPDGSNLSTKEAQYFVRFDFSMAPGYRIEIFTGRLSNSFENGRNVFTHFQEITKPQPPLF